MRWMAAARERLRAVFLGAHQDADMDDELRFHLEEEAKYLRESGLDPVEARRQARLRFGGVERVREEVRDARGVRLLEDLGKDLRYGARMLRKAPGFTAVAVLSLALGIGMTTAVFSVFNAVLLRPVVYPDPDRWVWLGLAGVFPAGTELVITPDFVDWQEQATSFDGLVAYNATDTAVQLPRTTVEARFASVTEDFWHLSGGTPMLGGLPDPRDRNAVVLSHRFFKQSFGADPDVVGRVILVNGAERHIAGVLPDGFRFHLPPPAYGPSFESRDIDAYMPRVLSESDRNRQGGQLLHVVGKLKAEVRVEEAKAELDAIRARFARENPGYPLNTGTLRVVPLQEQLIGNARLALWVMLAAAAFVFLIALANIANLYLAQSSTRHREAVVRAAIGASRGRLLRQFLTESLILALLGGLAGLLVAQAGLSVLLELIPQAVPRLNESTIDGRVLVFALGLSMLTPVVFGVVPAVSFWRKSGHRALRVGATKTVPTPRWSRWLVCAELGLAVVLLCGAGLMVKSLWRMNTHPAGFEPDRILVMGVPFSGPQYRNEEVRRAYLEEVVRRIGTVPGVEAASITTQGMRTGITVDGQPTQVTELVPCSEKHLVL